MTFGLKALFGLVTTIAIAFGWHRSVRDAEQRGFAECVDEYFDKGAVSKTPHENVVVPCHHGVTIWIWTQPADGIYRAEIHDRSGAVVPCVLTEIPKQ